MLNKFKTAPFDKTARFATLSPIYIMGAVTLFFAIIEVIVIKEVMVLPYLLVFWLIIMSGYFWGPTSYTVSETTIAIHRPIGDIVIPKSAVKVIEIADQIPIGIRVFGSGGAFGYYGKFRLTNGQPATLYCTCLDRVVVLKTEEKVYIISPFDPEEFCRILQVQK